MSEPNVSKASDIFTDEEISLAQSVEMTEDILLHAVRSGTIALSEFGSRVMEPVIAGQIGLNDKELAVAALFYRLLATVKTAADLNQLYHFQAVAACARLATELYIDIDLICADKVERAVEKYHGFSARLGSRRRIGSSISTRAIHTTLPPLTHHSLRLDNSSKGRACNRTSRSCAATFGIGG